MGKPNYSGIVKPVPPVSEIVPRLFQGMRPETYRGYDAVVSCEEHLARRPMDGFSGVVVHLALRDEDDFPLVRTSVEAAAHAAWHAWKNGGRILIHCSGGLNRSSLVTVEVLVLAGFDRHEAVRVIRESRDDFCLCNRAFERFALREQMPTAETSVFRADAA